MSSTLNSCSILLTYKDKVLLLQKDDVLNTLSDNTWHFIERLFKQNASVKKAIIQEVEQKIKIKLQDVNLLMADSSDEEEFFFHAMLTDNQVDIIERKEGSIHQFFSVSELSKIKLKDSTKRLLLEYASSFKKLQMLKSRSTSL